MKAIELTAKLYWLGVRVEARANDRLLFSPRRAVPQELLAEMKAYKAELLRFLNAVGGFGPIESGEEIDVAATRVWTAMECLRKSDTGDDAPLIFERATADGWVILSAGRCRLASWLRPSPANEHGLAMAFLIGNERESV